MLVFPNVSATRDNDLYVEWSMVSILLIWYVYVSVFLNCSSSSSIFRKIHFYMKSSRVKRTRQGGNNETTLCDRIMAIDYPSSVDSHSV